MRCLLCRWAISRAADRDLGHLSTRAGRHIATCAECRAFHDQVAAMGSMLAAARTRAPAPDRSHTPLPEPTSSFRRGALWTAAAAAAVALVVIAGPGSDNTEPAIDHSARASAQSTGHQPEPPSPAPAPGPTEPALAQSVDTLANDAEQGLRYVLRVSGLRASSPNQ